MTVVGSARFVLFLTLLTLLERGLFVIRMTTCLRATSRPLAGLLRVKVYERVDHEFILNHLSTRLYKLTAAVADR